MRKNISLFIVVGFACSCSMELKSGRTEKAGSEVSDNTQKPTEETEGVPGYLAQLDTLSAEVKDSRITIKGEPGTIASGSGHSAQDVVPKAWAVSLRRSAELADFTTSGAETELRLPASVLLGKTQTQADGSFVLDVPMIDTSEQLVVLSVDASLSSLVIKPSEQQPTSAGFKFAADSSLGEIQESVGLSLTARPQLTDSGNEASSVILPQAVAVYGLVLRFENPDLLGKISTSLAHVETYSTDANANSVTLKQFAFVGDVIEVSVNDRKVFEKLVDQRFEKIDFILPLQSTENSGTSGSGSTGSGTGGDVPQEISLTNSICIGRPDTVESLECMDRNWNTLKKLSIPLSNQPARAMAVSLQHGKVAWVGSDHNRCEIVIGPLDSPKAGQFQLVKAWSEFDLTAGRASTSGGLWCPHSLAFSNDGGKLYYAADFEKSANFQNSVINVIDIGAGTDTQFYTAAGLKHIYGIDQRGSAVYWAETGKVFKKLENGTSATAMCSPSNSVLGGILVNPDDSVNFVTDMGNGTRRLNTCSPDGSIVWRTALDNTVRNFFIDTVNNHVYTAEYRSIVRYNISGNTLSTRDSVYTNATGFLSVDLHTSFTHDPNQNKIFVVDRAITSFTYSATSSDLENLTRYTFGSQIANAITSLNYVPSTNKFFATHDCGIFQIDAEDWSVATIAIDAATASTICGFKGISSMPNGHLIFSNHFTDYASFGDGEHVITIDPTTGVRTRLSSQIGPLLFRNHVTGTSYQLASSSIVPRDLAGNALTAISLPPSSPISHGAIDTSQNQIYVQTCSGQPAIYRTNQGAPTGWTKVRDMASPSVSSCAGKFLALDNLNSQIYWIESTNPSTWDLYRADLPSFSNIVNLGNKGVRPGTSMIFIP